MSRLPSEVAEMGKVMLTLVVFTGRGPYRYRRG